MAITETGTWVQTEDDLKNPMPYRDFFKPDTAVADTSYVDAHKLDFGFNAREIHIFNTGAADLVYRWPRNDGTSKDNGVIPSAGSRIWRNANRSGIRFRVESSSATYRVEAIA